MSFADLLESQAEADEEEQRLEPWVRIQQNTFTNWANDKLRTLDLEVVYLRTGFKDGVKLARLMEVLTGRNIGRIKMKKNLSHIEASGNLAMALEAMRADGVRLVNIGAEDIAGGNLKLILGMIWTLIRRYQIGSQTKIPPKKLMLAWMNAVLHPHLKVRNFSSDLNNGIALHGIIEYCCPGTFPEWYEMNRNDSLGNCGSAMSTADELFSIPLVVSPENMASPDLDELSGMTYMSYYMAIDAPGYKATLNWVKQQITPTPVANFDTDWNNGYVLSALSQSLGGQVKGWPNIEEEWVTANQNAMDASEKDLGIVPIVSAKDIADPEVDHIAVMAYAAWHMHVQTATPANLSTTPAPVVAPPPHPPKVRFSAPTPTPTPPRTPTPEPEQEPFKEEVPVRVVIVDNWKLYETTTITVNAGERGQVRASAEPPSGGGMPIDLPVVMVEAGIYNIAFTPMLKGIWNIVIDAGEEPIQGSPFQINVYDASQAAIIKDGQTALRNKPYTYDVDYLQVGLDHLTTYVLFDGESVEHNATSAGIDRKRISFTPRKEGEYVVMVYCGGVEVPGSPFNVTCKASSDNESVFATGQGLRWAVKAKKTNFDLDLTGNLGKMLMIRIVGPSGKEVPVELEDLDEGRKFRIHYTPQEVGSHSISLVYDDLPIPGSPCNVSVRKGRIYVRDLSHVSYVGMNSQFILDAGEAGKGTIEIDSDLPIRNTEKIGERLYHITFVPKKSGVHDLAIRYGGDEVEGSPFEVDVRTQDGIY